VTRLTDTDATLGLRLIGIVERGDAGGVTTRSWPEATHQ
jgi:hypothetical protein